jgi:hypothetical protein
VDTEIQDLVFLVLAVVVLGDAEQIRARGFAAFGFISVDVPELRSIFVDAFLFSASASRRSLWGRLGSRLGSWCWSARAYGRGGRWDFHLGLSVWTAIEITWVLGATSGKVVLRTNEPLRPSSALSVWSWCWRGHGEADGGRCKKEGQ